MVQQQQQPSEKRCKDEEPRRGEDGEGRGRGLLPLPGKPRAILCNLPWNDLNGVK